MALPEGWLLSGQVDLNLHPWIGDHRVHDVVLLPGTALMALCLDVGRQIGVSRLTSLVLLAPFAFSDEHDIRQIQVHVTPLSGEAGFALKIRSKPASVDDDWTLHATANLVEGRA